VVAALFAFCVLAVLVRLVNLQVYQRAALEKRAESQRTNLLPVPAQRGDIVDRRGRVLAYSIDADTVCAEPNRLQNPAQAASRLCDALGDCDAAERAAIARSLGKKSAFCYVRHRIHPIRPDALRR
jgi:cell division protein FtsI (penicillin-binding protein 3)